MKLLTKIKWHLRNEKDSPTEQQAVKVKTAVELIGCSLEILLKELKKATKWSNDELRILKLILDNQDLTKDILNKLFDWALKNSKAEEIISEKIADFPWFSLLEISNLSILIEWKAKEFLLKSRDLKVIELIKNPNTTKKELEIAAKIMINLILGKVIQQRLEKMN